MYSFHLYKHKQLLNPSKPVQNQDKIQLSERAYHRIEEWKMQNLKVAQELFGTTKSKLPKINKPREKSEDLREIVKENPYLEDVFLKGLRKTEKKKHLGSYFLRVKYSSTDERLNTAICLNSSIDSTPRRPVSPTKLFPISKPKNFKVISHKTSFTPDPYNDPNNTITFRERHKSLEPTKGFFVTTKVQSPKSKLLISQKFSDFYSTIKGNKVYKNSII